jgi:hypothetical protein
MWGLAELMHAKVLYKILKQSTNRRMIGYRVKKMFKKT